MIRISSARVISRGSNSTTSFLLWLRRRNAFSLQTAFFDGISFPKVKKMHARMRDGCASSPYLSPAPQLESHTAFVEIAAQLHDQDAPGPPADSGDDKSAGNGQSQGAIHLDLRFCLPRHFWIFRRLGHRVAVHG
jgi:hypothetical protein